MPNVPPEAPLALHALATLDISAASGIALRGDALYVVADDELELAVYDLNGQRRGSIALQTGTLPEAAAQRKAAKPDFEALCALPDGSLLALGSGSTPKRACGAWLRFDRSAPYVQPVDLSELYVALAAELPELNIEGGAVLNDALYLCSRGNGSRRENALIRLDLAPVCERLVRGQPLPAVAVSGVVHVSLPELEGTPLTLTDLAVLGDELLFAAAAEASANTYDDGACAGSALGTLTPAGVVSSTKVVAPRLKIEGVCAQRVAGVSKLWLVADPDDRAAHAPLLTVIWAP